MIVNIIATAVLVLILGGAVTYIVRSKKNGVKCIGCPSGASCGHGSCKPTRDNASETSSPEGGCSGSCSSCCSSCRSHTEDSAE